MRALSACFKERNIPYREGVNTGSLSSFRIGGTAPLLALPQSVPQLIQTVQMAREAEVDFYVIGKGSNVLFCDALPRVLLISVAALNRITVKNGTLFAECGASMPRIAALAAASGMQGFSFACGIPGTLGGGIFMNAGAHGNNVNSVLKSVQIYDLIADAEKTLFNIELNTFYRKSIFQGKKSVILSAELALRPGGDPAALFAEIRKNNAARRASQPLDLPSAGCAFRRPAPDVPIGKFLDELGVKGMRVGDAQISPKHAAFIVNLGAATAADVLTLIQRIQKIAKEERGIHLEPELCVIPAKV